MHMSREPESGRVNSVKKALRILECFTTAAPEMTLTQLSRELDMPKSTLLNLIRTLEESGYLYRVRQSQNYRLGYKIMELGYSMRTEFPVVQFALPLMEELQLATGGFIYLTTHINGRVLYLECVYPQKRTVGYSITGKTLPMHCTGAGKAMLSTFTDKQIEWVTDTWGLERKTLNTITDREQLMQELALTRARGYALDLEEETPGVRCVSMAVRSNDGMAAGAISISGPVYSITDEKIPRYVKLLSDIASILSTRANLFPSMQMDSPFSSIAD